MMMLNVVKPCAANCERVNGQHLAQNTATPKYSLPEQRAWLCMSTLSFVYSVWSKSGVHSDQEPSACIDCTEKRFADGGFREKAEKRGARPLASFLPVAQG